MSDYPDFTLSALLKGIYAGDPKALAVDVAGNMIAMLKAMYGTTATDLKCDVDGNMSINLTAQELTRLLTRPTYGSALEDTYDDNVNAGVPTTLFDHDGEGILYGAYLTVDSTDVQSNDKWLFYIDLHLQNQITFVTIAENYFTQPYGAIPVCTRYDEVNFKYGLIWPLGVTFETGFKLRYQETHGRTPAVVSGISYALV